MAVEVEVYVDISTCKPALTTPHGAILFIGNIQHKFKTDCENM